MPLPPADKHQFPRSHGIVQPYGHHYRFGGAEPGAPLVLYVGGAISRKDYVQRGATSPDPIAAEFEKAFALVQPGPVGLLVCPCPVEIGGLDGFLEHFDAELLPAVGGAPSSLACAGYSNGAQFASYLAVAAGAKALSLIAAAGMQFVAEEVRPMIERVRREKAASTLPKAVLFRNAQEEVNDAATVRRCLHGLDLSVAGAKPGRHPFRDYAANGTVVEAFRFVLEEVGGVCST